MKFSNPTLVTITAPTCSGKTYLLERLIEAGMTRIVSTTTRAPRAGERPGVDYDFISKEYSEKLERLGAFAELVTFRGTRYGVTNEEMESKMNGVYPPVVILEPQGVKMYEELCAKNDWDIFKVFVTTPEKLRIERLNNRSSRDLWQVSSTTKNDYLSQVDEFNKVIQTHTDRLLSITGDERLWQTQNSWDAIVPGDDIEKALNFIEQGIKWRNSQNVQQNT